MREFTPNESPYARDLYPEHNASIAAWMADHGWPVTNAPPSLSGELFAWVHERGGRTFSLRVTREVLDFMSAGDIRATLDRLHAEHEMRHAPRGSVTLRYNEGNPRLVVSP